MRQARVRFVLLIIRFRKGDDQFYVALRIDDNNGSLIGQVGSSYSVGDDQVGLAGLIDVGSLLPWVLVYTRHGPDCAAPHFDYADQYWDAASPQCSVGGFNSGV